jgi:sterol desaturase/sphingolipid hydroxylase (fatty acid hydroxylase superfamily)
MEALLVPVGMFLVLALVELVLPNRRFPEVPFWRLRGTLVFLAYLFVASTAPLFWDGFLAEHRLFDARGLGTAAGALLAMLAVDFVMYAWHRTMHKVDFLWRWFHQMHHSAERIDVYGALYFHPLDMLGFTMTASLGLVWVVGVTPEAAVIANVVMTFLAMFQHTNIRTPAWLGYLVHRPENHSLHHERGLHAYNYGTLSISDMLFGTFKNPRVWEGEAGFYDGASARLGEILLGRDVSVPKRAGREQEPRDSSIGQTGGEEPRVALG